MREVSVLLHVGWGSIVFYSKGSLFASLERAIRLESHFLRNRRRWAEAKITEHAVKAQWINQPGPLVGGKHLRSQFVPKTCFSVKHSILGGIATQRQGSEQSGRPARMGCQVAGASNQRPEPAPRTQERNPKPKP